MYFDTTKESGETPTSAFIDAILDLAWCDSWFWQAYRPLCLRISPVHRQLQACITPWNFDTVWMNPGEIGSTAVYPPSWICVNSVCKVANTTLQCRKVHCYIKSPQKISKQKSSWCRDGSMNALADKVPQTRNSTQWYALHTMATLFNSHPYISSSKAPLSTLYVRLLTQPYNVVRFIAI